MNANASSVFSLALNHGGCDLADSDVSAISAALWSSSSDEDRRRAWKNKTKTVTGCDVWCCEHVRSRREAALGRWRKEVRLSRSSLVGSHARQWQCAR